jgi:hypothetical protein
MLLRTGVGTVGLLGTAIAVLMAESDVLLLQSARSDLLVFMFAEILQLLAPHNALRDKSCAGLNVFPRLQIAVAQGRHTAQHPNTAVTIRTALMDVLRAFQQLPLHRNQLPKP